MLRMTPNHRPYNIRRNGFRIAPMIILNTDVMNILSNTLP